MWQNALAFLSALPCYDTCHRLVPKDDRANLFSPWLTFGEQAFRFVSFLVLRTGSRPIRDGCPMVRHSLQPHHGSFGVYVWWEALLLETRRAEKPIEGISCRTFVCGSFAKLLPWRNTAPFQRIHCDPFFLLSILFSKANFKRKAYHTSVD